MSSPVLEVSALTKHYGGVHALDGVSFSIARGELLALIGPNGAGKSTCFNIVNGQIRPDSGRVRLAGRDITGLAPRHIARLGVGRTFQVATVFASMTVLENVQMALIAARGQVFGLWTAARHRGHGDALALLEQTGLAAFAARPAATLAYGDVKRLELAMALAGDPALLLMDEPTAGMSSDERQAMIALVRQLTRARGLAVLFTEHAMDVVFGHADRVVVLARGRLIADGSVEAVRDDPAVRAVYLGGASITLSQTP
ncbi:amino acid/amide ABC transporter ATP-binding protein 1 (HAAT family) [Ancylobacter aquaticus]|uniref:Amino acid/amide ABC transporter ATP-binding protein 1 (HAAT family) n=1 Tax=Ancylobacter aquaticus TaxID=100 RepID=A0A4R1I5U2_ANCAQ|nr:ABC transporter ATP-binding protein [Ancylobacter aquaticus]TCK30724.1 amino acid/amide ABC transporter ATP-binding protein 1 (HAAT family) [Ancylobacter aquaticus]